MRPSQVIERAREKVEEVAEKTGEVVGKGLEEGWSKAKGLGKDLRTELLRVYRKTRGRARAKLLKSKKGLSPVVAAVILIAVAVATSIAVGAWMGALTFTYTKTEELKITSMTFAGQSGNSTNTIQLAVKNMGTAKITVASAEVNYITKTVSGTLTYNASATGTITVESVGWTTGNKYRVMLLSSTGTTIAAYEDKA